MSRLRRAMDALLGRGEISAHDMQRLDVRDGDVVVVRFKDIISEVEYKRVQTAFQKARDHMHVEFKVMIITGGPEIGVLGRRRED